MEYITGHCCECDDIFYVPINKNLRNSNDHCIWCGGHVVYDTLDVVKDTTIPKMSRLAKLHDEK